MKMVNCSLVVELSSYQHVKKSSRGGLVRQGVSFSFSKFCTFCERWIISHPSVVHQSSRLLLVIMAFELQTSYCKYMIFIPCYYKISDSPCKRSSLWVLLFPNKLSQYSSFGCFQFLGVRFKIPIVVNLSPDERGTR